LNQRLETGRINTTIVLEARIDTTPEQACQTHRETLNWGILRYDPEAHGTNWEHSLSIESEKVELDSLVDLHAAASPEIVRNLGLQAHMMGSAFVSVASKLPATAILINRALGLGLGTPESKKSIGDIIETYRQAGVERYFVQCHPDAEPDQIESWLTVAGLEKARAWQKFSRGREAPPPYRTDLRMEEIGPEHGEAFGKIVCDAFDLGNAAVPWLATLPGRKHWHIFMTFDGEEPAGVGTLFVKDGMGDIDMGATAPKFRGRGSQGAVIARRIECALDLGCKEMVTCTGVAVPGDPQHSYANILRAGFRKTYIRDNYAPPRGQ
jgi:GNAT superfamily N-acetyltransferase